MGQHRRKPLDEHFSRRRKVARSRRKAAADHHDALGADRGGLVDHALVVVDRRHQPIPAGGGEQAAAAIAGDAQAACPEDARRLGDAGLLHHVAPRRDAGKAMARRRRDRLRQLPLPAHGREVEGEVAAWDSPDFNLQPSKRCAICATEVRTPANFGSIA